MLLTVDQPGHTIMQAGARSVRAFVPFVPDESRREIDTPQQLLVARFAHTLQNDAIGVGQQQQVARRCDLAEEAPHLGAHDLGERS